MRDLLAALLFPGYIDSTPLAKYSKELGLTDITLEDLIESHRRQRVLVKRSTEELHAEVSRAAEEVRNEEHDLTWVKIEQVAAMSVAELIDLCKGHNGQQ